LDCHKSGKAFASGKVVVILFACFFQIKTAASQDRKQVPQNLEKSDSAVKAYELELNIWHEKRIKNLTREYGWLSLVALPTCDF
jgi:hypothetical protein